MKKYKIAVIEARVYSSRLPGKIMMPLNGIPMLEHIVNRVKNSEELDHIILATTKEKEDDLVEIIGAKLKVEVFRGSKNNVMKRVLDATMKYKDSILVQITADNPFIESKIIDTALQVIQNENVDYVCNNIPRLVPIGCEVRVYRRKTLAKLNKNSIPAYHKSNVTSIFYEKDFNYKIINISTDQNFIGKKYRLTVDEVNDYILADTLYKKLYKGRYIPLSSVISFLSSNKNIANINSSVVQKQVIEG